MTAPATEAQATAPASVAVTAIEVSSAAQSVASESVASSAAEPAAGTPVVYDLKLPADVQGIDAAIIERTAAIARAQGLQNDAAQTLLNAQVAEVAAQQAALVEAWKPGGAQWIARDTEWRTAAMADTEIGGSPEKLAKSVELAQQVMAKFGGAETVQFLKETGLGSHPAALKLLAKIGAAMSESSLVVGSAAASSAPKTVAEKLYGPDGTGKPKPE